MKMKRATEPRRIVVGKSAMRNLKAFMKTTPLKDKPDNYSTPKRYYNPPSPKKRRSGRSHPSPMKADPFAIDTFTGKKRASMVVGKSMQIMPQHLSK